MANNVVAYGAAALLGAAIGGILVYETKSGSGEEERPPIIVQNGSAEFNIEYPDETNGSKGTWQAVGSSGKYRHVHTLTGPNRMRTSVFNGSCTGGAWRSGSLVVTLTNAQSQTWTTDIDVNGNHVEVTPGTGTTVETFT